MLAEIIVEQDEKGKVHVHETGRGGLGAVIGGVAGKYLGRPFKKGDLKEVGEAMVPDSSAFLLLAEDIYSEAIVDSLSGVSANVITLAVGDELSGQIASYVAGAAADDQGNVVAGLGGAAVGLIAGTALAVPAVVGALVVGLVAKLRDTGFSDKRLESIGEGLKPGSSAIIAVVEHTWC